MGIEIKSSSNEIERLLTNSINRILEKINAFLMDDTSIVVTDLEHVPSLFPSTAKPNEYDLYKRLLKSSFGITQPKIFLGGEKKHLLVINIENIQSLDLTDNELDGVIAHELGHIFNVPEKEIEDFDKQKEFFADYFAKSNGLKDGLLDSISKYLKQTTATNIDLFELRIQKLNSNETFKGSIKII